MSQTVLKITIRTPLLHSVIMPWKFYVSLIWFISDNKYPKHKYLLNSLNLWTWKLNEKVQLFTFHIPENGDIGKFQGFFKVSSFKLYYDKNQN